MTLEEAAERLHCSVKTVRRRIASQELRASHIARGVWEIRDEDLDAYLDAVANRPRELRSSAETVAPVSARPARTRRRRGTGGDGRLTVTRDMGRAA